MRDFGAEVRRIIATNINRLIEITVDLEQRAFCPDEDCTDICARCDKVKPITAAELREYYREVRKALVENAKLKVENSRLWSEAEAAVNDIQKLVVFSEDPCKICDGPGDCETCHFQWRGVEEE